MQPARILDERIDKYGRKLWDVEFDYKKGEVSKGHFAICTSDLNLEF